MNIGLSNTNPKYLPQRNENICLHQDLYANVHSNFIQKSEKVEAT